MRGSSTLRETMACVVLVASIQPPPHYPLPGFHLVELLKRAPLPLEVLVRRVLGARDGPQHGAHPVFRRLLWDGSTVFPPVTRRHGVGHGVRRRRTVCASALGLVRHPRPGGYVLLPGRYGLGLKKEKRKKQAKKAPSKKKRGNQLFSVFVAKQILRRPSSKLYHFGRYSTALSYYNTIRLFGYYTGRLDDLRTV